MEGIRVQNQTGATVSGNDVQNVSTATGTNVQGIYVVDTRLSNISANKIHNLIYTGGSITKIYGLSSTNTTFNTAGTPSSNTFSNNAVYDFTSNCTSTTWTLSGINNGGGYGDKYYYNTVYIATTLPATYPAAAFANGQGSIATFCTNIDVRNNILFMKASSTSASATLFAYHTTATTLAGSTFNYNDLYSVTPGVGSATYHTARFNSINYTTLANWQVVAGEANSISTDPLLNSTTNVQPQLGAPVIGAANSSGTGITTDILGVARSAGVPPAGSTMGAYENGLDGSGPSISYTVFANTISTADRTLTPVTITDPSVVNTTTFKPRLYFKKSTDANNYVGNTSGDNGWKYVETSSAGSPFDFTTAYSLLQSTVVVGDVIQYFVVAQDQASTPNVGINSGTFAATPASVALTIGAFPLTGTINSYTVTPSISGTITVPGTYPSLTLAGGAFAAINAATVVGNITIEITADLAGETGFALLEEFAAPYTITIKPTGAPRTITGTSADGLIKLNGADRVTIDGSLGSTSNTICPLSVASRDLTINNTNVAVASVVVWIKTNIANGATNNTIKNCNIVGSGNTQTLAGIFSGSSSISITSLGTGNNNNTIVNNNISRTQYGIYSQGASAANKNTGNTINQNLINTASPNNVQLGGILVGFEDNLVVSGNNIANLSTTGDVFGISAGLGSTFVTTTTVGNEVGNVLISKNILNAIASTSATGFTSIGIGVGAIPATKTADVSNNMLSNITSLATPSDYTSGITIGGGAGANNVYFNTVNMAGSVGAATASSFALAVAGTAPIPTLNIRNNILINSQTSTGVGQSYAIGLAYTSTVGNYANLVSTNNNLYTSGTSAAFAKVGSLTQGSGTNLTTLALWTAETGRDVAPLTKNVDVTFISGSNLHIDASNASNIVNLNGTAATGTGVTDDIDCDSRGSLPDIGADQFAASQVWTGITNTDYGTGTNWLTGIVPSSGDDNTIPTALTNYPVLDVDRTIGNLVLGVNTTMDINGKILTINGAVTATSTGTLTGSATSNLSLGGTAGTVYFTQTTAATRSLNDLTLSVSSSGTLGNTLDVYGTINTNSGATTGGVLNLNSQNVTLKSNTTNTARIARLKDNGSNLTGADNVTMERFIKLRTPGTGAGTGPNGRAYRLLTPTVTTTSSIKFNWMNNENNTAIGTNVNSNAPGYGTQISGSGGDANGFDKTATNQSSLYLTTNGATPTYSGVGNTSGTLNNLTGYFMYVRGDRSMDMTIPLAVGMATSSTTLRATGTLTTGPVTSFTNPLSTTIGDLNLVTNPYPSPINWTMVKSASGIGIGDAYTLWDPNKGTRGGFETVTSGGITSGGGATTSIQSGQAFFVQTATATPAVSIQETHKVAGNNNTVFLVPPETFRAKLFFNEPSGYRRMSDGVVTVYDDSYSPALDGMDAIEINNWDENIAITRSGKHLAIESRPVIAGRDTMPLFMNNMKQMNYELEFEGSHFTNPATQATLIDNFTGLRTPLSVTGITVVPITISSIAGSSSTDRFMVVFGPTAPLPVDVLTVKAYQKNGGVQVDWVVNTETNMNSYEVERSANGTQFSKSVSVASLGNTNQPRTYGWFDTNPFGGDNFYRIKSIDKAGNVKYSSIAKVNIAKGDPGITVYPNPVNGNMFNLQLNNLAKGIYVISLTNNLGQQVYSSTVQHNGGSATQTVELRNKLPGGVYDLQISGEGVKMTERLIKN